MLNVVEILQPVLVLQQMLVAAIEGLLYGRWQGIAAIAPVVVERDRGKNQGHGAGCGHGAGHAQIGQIQAEHVEILLREVQALACRHIGGANYGKGAFAPLRQIIKSGVAEQGAFELLLQQIATPELGRS